MDFMVLKSQMFHSIIARRILIRALLFSTAMTVLPLMQFVHFDGPVEPLFLNSLNCTPISTESNEYSLSFGVLKPVFALALPVMGSIQCQENENVTINVFDELVQNGFLDNEMKALCVGEGSNSAVSALGELGFDNTVGVDRHPFFSLWKKRFVYELDFKDNSFDFVYSRALQRVSVPALLVLEIERVLRPGGFGAMLVAAHDYSSSSLIRSATPVSSFIKSSDVVHVSGIGYFTLVVFKKRFDTVASFEHFRLPKECPSVENNKPYMRFLEPLVVESPGRVEAKMSFLPNFMNISSRNRLVYINIGAGESVSSSITDWFKPFYPVQSRSINVYVVDHDPFALSSYVKKPGITFVYHPDLAGSKGIAGVNIIEDLSAPAENEGFDFVSWFKETVAPADFVVLMMNAKEVELKLLFRLFESGSICHVDELFLRCSDGTDCKDNHCGECSNVFKGLRSSGVYVHQWWGD
ncbi:Methyltransferase type 11 [Dillenia turbinata]|uniref:Methyltransferase type 11 n=1 Tax=Dillenia turbinata TaxID=194707 RepID=A0AAN8V3E9_9MAGN